jgi:L-ascorbate metabolism protein UlaG (beta-lactamase superfamily)
LGVGSHLKAWDVPSNKITELDWWQDVQLDALNLVCTPAQHFSGRKLNNGQSTLWSSWVIQSKNENIYFSGDSGYANHFKEIGDKYGPFDLALMECGQYDEMWSDIHMMPEETALAGIDIKANKIMPIHWAGFKLALHEWTDPIERINKKAKTLNLNVITPRIGEEIIVKDAKNNYTQWWKTL